MIIELLIGASVVALGAMAMRRRASRREGKDTAETATEGASPGEAGRGSGAADSPSTESKLARAMRAAQVDLGAKSRGRKGMDKGKDAADAAAATPALRPLTPRGLRVGDVLLYADAEMWLAGEVHFDEEGFALSLFPTPGAPRSTFVLQLDEQAREVALLHPTTEVPGGSIPTELPVGGLRYALRRRGQAVVSSIGEHLPLVTERCEYVILGAAGGRTLVVVDFRAGSRLSLVGEIVQKEMYDLLPGGD